MTRHQYEPSKKQSRSSTQCVLSYAAVPLLLQHRVRKSKVVRQSERVNTAVLCGGSHKHQSLLASSAELYTKVVDSPGAEHPPLSSLPSSMYATWVIHGARPSNMWVAYTMQAPRSSHSRLKKSSRSSLCTLYSRSALERHN